MGFPRFTRPLGITLLTVFLLSPLASEDADAQVAVYKIRVLGKTGRNINFSFFDGGYFAAPAEGGTGSFLFFRGTGKDKTYTTSSDSGQYFVAFNRKGSVGVISAAGGDGTATTAFLLFGDVNRTFRTPGTRTRIPRSLRGTAIVADSELNFDEPAADGSQGFAGAVNLYATFQSGASLRNDSVSGAIAELTEQLESIGYQNEAAVGDDTGDGGTTGDGSGDDTSTDGSATTGSSAADLDRRPFAL